MEQSKKKMTKEEFEAIKEQLVSKLNLVPIVKHNGYFADLENQDVYSFRKGRVTKLKACSAFGGYLVINMTPDGSSKQKNYYLHHVMYAAYKKIEIGEWRKDDKRVTLHHDDADPLNNHYTNIIPVDSQHNAEWKRKMSEQAKGRKPIKVSDEEVFEMRESYELSNMPITTFARLNAKFYGIDEVYMYNILRNKVRTNIAI